MDGSLIGLGVVLLLILGAEFVNGFTDAPNAIATIVATRVLSPLRALMMASVLNFMGAVVAIFLGAKVATTIGKGIIDPTMTDLTTWGLP
jgi:PiT family inorganic phosphate transporter